MFANAETEHSFAAWDIGVDARTIPQDKVLIMSERALKNRGFVRDWAIAAHFAGRLKTLEDMSREEKQ